MYLLWTTSTKNIVPTPHMCDSRSGIKIRITTSMHSELLFHQSPKNPHCCTHLYSIKCLKHGYIFNSFFCQILCACSLLNTVAECGNPAATNFRANAKQERNGVHCAMHVCACSTICRPFYLPYRNQPQNHTYPHPIKL